MQTALTDSAPVTAPGSATELLYDLRQYADLDNLPRAAAEPGLRGRIRASNSTFKVIEELGFEPTGQGEHVYVRLRKSGHNTRWLAKRLAEYLALDYRAVSHAGLKDRHAQTEQWFSLHMPGKGEPDWQSFAIDGVEILEVSRHETKLRPGQLLGNRFVLQLRDVEGDPAELDANIDRVRRQGVPNYFGAQRFGRAAANLEILMNAGDGQKIGREAKAFGLSALRAALFNGYLAQRIKLNTWDSLLDGERPWQERNSDSGFSRYLTAAGKSYAGPAGLLWGTGKRRNSGFAVKFEDGFYDRFTAVTGLLEQYGAQLRMRPLVAHVANLDFAYNNGVLELRFMLGAGSYATVVLRELLRFQDSQNPDALTH
ncbi:MAG: tRNA pseudouridine(13) synthase TruD [Gammaproteobacteria bacterium]